MVEFRPHTEKPKLPFGCVCATSNPVPRGYAPKLVIAQGHVLAKIKPYSEVITKSFFPMKRHVMFRQAHPRDQIFRPR